SPLKKGGRGVVSRDEPRSMELWINENGELVAETELGTVKFTKPVEYKEIDGKRVNVDVEYSIQNTEGRSQNSAVGIQRCGGEWHTSHLIPDAGYGIHDSPLACVPYRESRIMFFDSVSKTQTPDSQSLIYGFKVASYDKRKELIIDPLLASTFLGGSGESEGAYSMALDSDGNVYVTGYTTSSDFPTTFGAYDVSGDASPDNSDVFVSKLSSDLSILLASTFLGGSGGEGAYSMALDSDGNVYVTGYTTSPDFPTTSGAYDASADASSDNSDVFVSKLSGDLGNLLASTFIGGSGHEYAYSMALDSESNIYATGYTESPDFPTTSGAYDVSGDASSDNSDVFVSKLSSDLSTLLASSFLGGSGGECAYSIAMDSGGNVYLAGETESSDFPATPDAYDTSYFGFSYDHDPGPDYEGYYRGDAFVTKLDSNLSNLLASTFLGGGGNDHARSLTTDTSGNIYVTGFTSSSDFPTTSGAYDTSLGVYGTDDYAYDVFVTKLDSNLSGLLASTYLGGSTTGRDKRSGQDYAWSIAIDPKGDIYVTGYTDSSGFPRTSNAYDTSGPDDDTIDADNDAFVSKLDSDLSSLIASTFLGGYGNDDAMTLWGEYGNDEARSLVIDSNGNVYVVGHTNSPDFPTTSGAYDTSFSSLIPVPTVCATPCAIYYVDGYDVFISKFDGNLSADTTSPTPTPTVTVTATPTPTDKDCKAETITTDPEKKLVIKRNQSDTVTVSVLGKDGCPVEGAVVKARLNRRSKKKISVTPEITTDAEGKAVFTVTAYNKKGTAKIVFSPKGLKMKMKAKLKVEVK
ncbi:MAG: SBBP repeat-containing protein, partial [Taibaiella sp.]|nr:SBBP repeat-containing protein [Taibaiella sp.]